MSTSNPFPAWLSELAMEAVVVCLNDINAEAIDNMRSFSISTQEAEVVTVSDVVAFADGVIQSRRDWLNANHAGPMQIYWWHDEQAGQLCFSLVSTVQNKLPFLCEVLPATTFEEIAADWLGSPWLHGIAWEELQPLEPGEVEPEVPAIKLSVWTMTVP